MERFSGQPLRERPHIAVLFYDAIGDFVVATPLLRGLRAKHPGCTLDYFGGERTRQLEAASPLVDSRYSVFGPGTLVDLPAYLKERRSLAGDYDLVVNCDDHPVTAMVAAQLATRYAVGRCYDRELRSLLPDAGARVDELWQQDWAAPDFLARYGDLLGTQFIGEILCRLARVETDFARTEVPTAEPPGDVPPVLISTGGKRSAKLWPTGHWLALLGHCQARGLTVGLLGDAPANQRSRYHSGDSEDHLLASSSLLDLRGAFTLPQVGGALQRARVCVTVDNGIMHLAGAVGTPTLALFGASPWRVWAPPVSHLQVMLGDEPCPLCEQNRFRNEACLREQHVCLESLTPAMVAARLDALLAVP
jgi:heptosyltransferase III